MIVVQRIWSILHSSVRRRAPATDDEARRLLTPNLCSCRDCGCRPAEACQRAARTRRWPRAGSGLSVLGHSPPLRAHLRAGCSRGKSASTKRFSQASTTTQSPRRASAAAIQTWPAVLRPAHLVGVFSIDCPAPRVAIPAELEELVFAGLGSVGRAAAGVDRRLHGNTAASFPGALPLSFGTILTVILFSLRYARIRRGSTRSVPEQSRSVGGVPAWNVLKRDHPVIGF